MELFDQVKKRFEEKYKQKSTPWVRPEIADNIVNFKNLAKREFPNGALLDIGCGNGWLSIYFAKEGFSVQGIDSSPTAIKEAEDKKVENTDFQAGDALDFPYKPNSFDIIFDRGLLHHIPESKWTTYKEGLLKVLKPNGLFYLGVFSDKSIKQGFSPKEIGKMWREVKDDTGYLTYDHFFNENLIREIFEKDFEIIKVEEEEEAQPNGSLIMSITMRKKGHSL